MANLKRNAIELVTGVDGEEIETQVYYSSPFIPLKVTYEAMDLVNRMSKRQEEESEKDMIDELANFVATGIYGGQFTKDELANGLHAPQAINELQEQVMFVAQGRQSDHSKKLVEQMKKD